MLPFKNLPGNFYDPVFLLDGSILYFDAHSYWGGHGGNDILHVKLTPTIDLNVDGIVDSLNMCLMVDNWYSNSKLCDITPLLLGDGVVDVLDLTDLAERLFEEYPSVGLVEEVSFWTLRASGLKNLLAPFCQSPPMKSSKSNTKILIPQKNFL